jgi:hypothetical protein
MVTEEGVLMACVGTHRTNIRPEKLGKSANGRAGADKLGAERSGEVKDGRKATTPPNDGMHPSRR